MKYLVLPLLWMSISAQTQITRSICFLGNSYTYTNDLPGMISSLANADGNTLIKDQNTPGGYTFQGHSTNTTSLAKISSQDWDYVVLQEQSQLPSFPWSQVSTDVLPYAQILCDSIRSNFACSIPVFFDTWGRQTGDPQWDSIDTFTEMNQRLYNAYEYMANAQSGLLCPVGIAYEHIANDMAPVVDFNSLYVGDGSHPTVFGTYLAACLFYEELFETPVVGNSYVAGGMTTLEAAYLQDVAHHVLTAVDSIETTSFLTPQAAFSYAQTGSDFNFYNESLHSFFWVWSFGDGATSIEESPTHTYASSGTYEITLVAFYCGNQDTLSMTVNLTDLALDPIMPDKDDLIYPNPSTGIIYIPASMSIAAIYSLDGKQVVNAPFEQEILLPEPGTYFIQTTDKKLIRVLIVED